MLNVDQVLFLKHNLNARAISALHGEYRTLQGNVDQLMADMQRAIDDGEFPAPADAEAVTKYLYAVLQGMAVLAGAGASREELERVAETTLAMWPSR